MLGSPNASPAWIVVWKFSRCTYWKASRWRVGGIAGLGAGDVEADHAVVAPAHRQLGDLPAARRRAHGRGDDVDGQVGAGRAAGEAVEHRLDHLVERQPGLGAQLGRHAHLGVDDAVGGQVLGALVGDPLDRVAVLHHADGVGERLEVQHEVVALGAAVEPLGELVDVGGRQAVVAVLAGQLDDRGRPQATVEVVVQQHLGRPGQQLGGGE